jgi:hypothetical protein
MIVGRQNQTGMTHEIKLPEYRSNEIMECWVPITP